jgi:hypothetical protein
MRPKTGGCLTTFWTVMEVGVANYLVWAAAVIIAGVVQFLTSGLFSGFFRSYLTFQVISFFTAADSFLDGGG